MTKIDFTYYDDEDDEVEVQLPAKFQVCSRCHGEGRHVNPNVDGHGITSEEMDELGPEFLEDYMGGVYDVQCEKCGGMRVVAVVDEDQCDPKLLAKYHEHMRDLAEERHEREMGY